MREGWEPQRVGDHVQQVKRAERVVSGKRYDLLGVRWYSAGPFLRETVSAETSAAKTLNRVKVGDFIYNRLFAWKGSFGVVGDDLTGAFVSNEFPTYRTNSDSLVTAFLRLLMSRPTTWARIEIESTGSTAVSRNRWKEAQFEEWLIPVPPLCEQRRIVDLMRAADEYVAAADKRVETAKTARGALLADLLSNPGDDWAQVPLDHVAELKLGKMLSKERATGPEQWPYLRNSNVQDGRLDLSDLKTMTFSHQDRATYSLVSGDILVCEGGDPGRSVLLKEDLKGICFQKALHRVRATGVSPEFLALEIRQAYCDRRISDLCTNTTISHLTAEKFGRMRIAVPPVAEQHRIVDLMRVVDDEVTTATKVTESARHARAALLSDLLSGNHEIPASYDRFLEAA